MSLKKEEINMYKLIRFIFSGMIGLLIVATLFILMGMLIDGSKPTSLTDQSIKPKIKFETLPPQTEKREIIEVQKAQKKLPKKQESPSLEITEFGMLETGKNSAESMNNLGSEISKFETIGNKNGAQYGANGGTTHDGPIKIYEHYLKFPEKARKAGITKGRIDAKAVFTPKHKFIRFEIIKEEPVGYFRDILYQLDFSKNHAKHLKHRDYQRFFKHKFRDAESEYVYTYRFLFDLYAEESVRFYMSKQ